MSTIVATRYHDFSAGHVVMGHESKCAQIHGHNYRVHFTVVPTARNASLDSVGRVLDFSVINTRLCVWLEREWDHRFLIYHGHPWARHLFNLDSSVVLLPFNPTAERMGEYLLQTVGPLQLRDTGTQLVSVLVEETRKCCAEASL